MIDKLTMALGANRMIAGFTPGARHA